MSWSDYLLLGLSVAGSFALLAGFIWLLDREPPKDDMG